MWRQAEGFNQLDEVCCVQNKQSWPQHRSLWNAADQFYDWWPNGPAADVLTPTGQIRVEPPVSGIMDAERRLQALEEYWVLKKACYIRNFETQNCTPNIFPSFYPILSIFSGMEEPLKVFQFPPPNFPKTTSGFPQFKGEHGFWGIQKSHVNGT